jgi:hypothetical protein
MPLFRQVRLAERFDIAIMSTKGMSVTAARMLADRLCGKYDIPLAVLHDFDKSGFSIVGTLSRNTRRYTFKNQIRVIDLGLRLEDVRQHGLQSESVTYKSPRGQASDPSDNLRENGATEEEIDFLVTGKNPWSGYRGQRVELNAFTAEALIAWIESKLRQHRITKLVPDKATLTQAYRRAAAVIRINDQIPKMVQGAFRDADAAKVRAGLVNAIRGRLEHDADIPYQSAGGNQFHRKVITRYRGTRRPARAGADRL